MTEDDMKNATVGKEATQIDDVLPYCPTCDGYGSAHGGMGPLCEDCIGSGVREEEE
jgi:DnaJ-class molecular chaperone